MCAKPRANGRRPVRVAIVQQGVWEMQKESLPLAAGYLKATLLEDDDLRRETEVSIHNFNGGTTTGAMVRDVLVHDLPDVLAFSVFGWNVRQFTAISETYKQLRPDGLVVWGGTHVSNQAPRVFQLAPWVDVIVNGEGEYPFRSIVRAYVDARRTPELWSAMAGVPGLSVNHPDGEIIDTGDAVRIQDLDTIPSPFLTGAVELLDDSGEFRYDVALMETNRGCPYKCGYCYWGGAVGQKVRKFDRARLREEVEVFARLKVESLVLCDANFGLLPSDVEFIEDVIRIRERHGYPRTIDTSWAKNKSKAFYEVVRRMSEVGLRSSFTLALQTLDDQALSLMHRRNMKLNDWAEMVEFIHTQGLDLYAELIWGAPGESRDDFLDGYNRLSRHTSRIAAYPLLILPNTSYFDEREQLGLVTVRGEADDFEYVLASDELSLSENMESQPFLLLVRTLGEHMILRYTWHAVRELCSLEQGSALWAMGRYLGQSSHPVAVQLRHVLEGRTVVDSAAVGNALRVLYTDKRVEEFLLGWLERDIRPSVGESEWRLICDAFRFDWLSRPLMDTEQWVLAPLAKVTRGGETSYLRRNARFSFPLLAVFGEGEARAAGRLKECLSDEQPGAHVYDFEYPDGFSGHIDSHEIAAHYFPRVSISDASSPSSNARTTRLGKSQYQRRSPSQVRPVGRPVTGADPRWSPVAASTAWRTPASKSP